MKGTADLCSLVIGHYRSWTPLLDSTLTLTQCDITQICKYLEDEVHAS